MVPAIFKLLAKVMTKNKIEIIRLHFFTPQNYYHLFVKKLTFIMYLAPQLLLDLSQLKTKMSLIFLCKTF